LPKNRGFYSKSRGAEMKNVGNKVCHDRNFTKIIEKIHFLF